MTPNAADPARQRQQRKLNLLLASRLARGQALGAFDELATQADAVADRIARLRQWLSNPLLWAAGSATAALVASASLRRVRLARVLRWGWLAWRLWRRVGPELARQRAAG